MAICLFQFLNLEVHVIFNIETFVLKNSEMLEFSNLLILALLHKYLNISIRNECYY